MRQRRPGEDDRHAGRQDHDDRKRSQRLAVGDDPVFLGRPEYGVEAVVLDQPLALATEEQDTVGRLFDQCHVGIAKLPEKACKHAGIDAPKWPLFTERRSRGGPARTPPCSAITERIWCVSVDR